MASSSRGPLTRSRGAFTLVEVIVTVGIICVLAFILISAVSHVRGSATKAKCISNLRQIGVGWMAYTSENKGRLPVPGDDNRMIYSWSGEPVGIGQVIEAGFLPPPQVKYTQDIKERGIYACPGLIPMEKYIGGGDQGTYAVDPRNGRYRADIDGPGSNYASWTKSFDVSIIKRAQVMCSDSSAHNERPNVLFLDGHIEGLDASKIPNSYQNTALWDFIDQK